jgi:hypothetical protein
LKNVLIPNVVGKVQRDVENKMKTIDLSMQEKENFCLCSVIQAMFKRHGVEISQEEIAKNLIKAGDRFIPTGLQIRQFMSKHGFSYSAFFSYETPFNEPDELLKEMSANEGVVGFGHHAYLLKSFDHDIVKLIDPKDGKEVSKSYLSLLKDMRQDGFFGLVKYIS